MVYLDLYSDKVWGFSVFFFFHFAHPQAIFTDSHSLSRDHARLSRKLRHVTRLFSLTGVYFQEVDVRYIAQSLISRSHEGQG